MKEPRDYQDAAHTSTWNYIHDPANFTGAAANPAWPKCPLVVEATGLGKSLNIAMMIWALVSQYRQVRVLQLCHVAELVESNYLELMGMWPLAPAGVYAAGLGQRNDRAQITFAMINSVHKRPATFGRVDFILVDEAHRLSPSDAAMYSKFIAALREVNPNLIVIGYTATDYRMKGGRLTDMELFDDVVYDIGGGETFLWAVEQGYLIRPVPTDPGFQLDDSGIGISGGDFKNGQASAALHEQDIIERAVDYSIKVAREEGRRSAICFNQSIEDADLVAEMLTYKGFPTEAVHSRMTLDRAEVLEAHKRGDLWGVTNQDILTTGWNNPRVELMIGLRVTRSPGLWVQMVGRMTRPLWTNHYFGSRFGHNGGPPMDMDEQGRHNVATFNGRWNSIRESGKIDARVLDFCGNTERLGPINYPNLPKKRNGSGGGEQPVRTCSIEKNDYDHYEEGRERVGCEPGTYHHSSVKVCPHCGYEWPKKSELKTKASESALVSDGNPLGLEAPPPPPEKEYAIEGVHEMTAVVNVGKTLKKDKEGNVIDKKLDTMKVTYRSGYSSYPEWICFNHKEGSFPRRKAEKWWRAHNGRNPVPENVEEAVDRIDELKKPKFIKVWINNNFPSIEDHDHIGHKFEPPPPLDLTNPDAAREQQLYEPEPDPVATFSGGFSGESYYDDEIPF